MRSLQKFKGRAAVIGGILIHLTLGNLYSFGNMMTYMVSYMHILVDESINYSNFIWVNSITTAAQGFFMVIGGILESHIGPKLTCLIGCSLLSAGIMLTRFTIEVSLFTVVLTYGLLSGIGISLTYVTPLACGMQWYPDRKGLINGLIVGGFGLGALGSTTFQTHYLNPNNLPPQPDGYFTNDEILSQVPGLFVVLGSIFIFMQYLGCLLISKPPKDNYIPEEHIQQEGQNLLECSQENDSSLVIDSVSDVEVPTITAPVIRELKPKDAIWEKTFYIFWMIYFLNTIAIGYVNAMYKSFGQTFIADDHFLAQVGSFAAVFNCLGRVAWGRLMDKTSFKLSMRFLTLVLTLLFATLPLTQYMGKVGFAGWIWLIFFTFSGTFVLMPTVTEKAYGAKHYSANYGLLFTSQTISGPLIAVVNQSMLNAFGYSGCFVTVAVVLSLSLGMTFIVPRGL